MLTQEEKTTAARQLTEQVLSDLDRAGYRIVPKRRVNRALTALLLTGTLIGAGLIAQPEPRPAYATHTQA